MALYTFVPLFQSSCHKFDNISRMRHFPFLDDQRCVCAETEKFNFDVKLLGNPRIPEVGLMSVSGYFAESLHLVPKRFLGFFFKDAQRRMGRKVLVNDVVLSHEYFNILTVSFLFLFYVQK